MKLKIIDLLKIDAKWDANALIIDFALMVDIVQKIAKILYNSSVNEGM